MIVELELEGCDRRERKRSAPSGQGRGPGGEWKSEWSIPLHPLGGSPRQDNRKGSANMKPWRPKQIFQLGVEELMFQSVGPQQ